MNIRETNISGCFVLEPKVFEDSRGYFMETFHQEKLEKALQRKFNFVQENQSVSNKHVLRGMHFQKGEFAQAKIGRVIRGRAFDVVVDLREDSPSFKQIFSIELSEYNKFQIYIPKGLAHGFLALEEHTLFAYLCDAFYNAEADGGIMYNDPDLGIDWGINDSDIILSEKDKKLPYFKDLFP